MRHPRSLPLALLLGFTALLPTAISAQQGWSVAPFAEGGVLLPTRPYGDNIGNLTQERVFQVVGELQPVATFGAGLDIASPYEGVSFRARFQTTLGGEMRGRVQLCELEQIESAACDPITSDLDVRSFTAEVRFLQGRETSRIRPFLGGGIGVRSYSSRNIPTCPTSDPSIWATEVCPRAVDIPVDPGIAPTVFFGGGLHSLFGPLQLNVGGEGHISSFSGGINTAEGGTLIDASLNVSASFRIF